MKKEDENIDIVPGREYKILQNRSRFSYGVDAILLSEFTKAKGTVVDLGTGTGIIPIRLVDEKRVDKIYGVEIQSEVANMAARSVKLNSLEEKIEIIDKDLKSVHDIFGPESIDVVVTNPPYMKKDAGVVNKDDNFAISRHEIKCDLEDILELSKYILKPLGSLFMVHRMERLVDIFYNFRKYNIEPKRVRFVQSNINSKPHLVLVEGRKGAGEDLKIEKSLIIYDEEGNYTEELLKIYE